MKVYEVTFNRYTDNTQTAVANNIDVVMETPMILCLEKKPFLITESQISDVMNFGDGIRELKFIGNLWEGLEDE